MSDDPSGFMAYTPITDETRLIAEMDRAMASLGFIRAAPPNQATVGGFDWSYRNADGATLPWFGSTRPRLTDALGDPLAVWTFFPLGSVDLQRLGSKYLDSIRSACVGTDVVFGRAYHATLVDMIAPVELKGAIDMLTWVQYFGPDLSARIGPERLRTAPFFAVESLPNGAHLARTAGEYGDVWPWEQRRPLMRHLGFIPRKLYCKTGPDTQEELRWLAPEGDDAA